MSPDLVLVLGRESTLTILAIAGPILGAVLVVGVAVSVVQAVTQVQEMTLTFIPKLVAVVVVLGVLGHWMLGVLVRFTTTLWLDLPTWAR